MGFIIKLSDKLNKGTEIIIAILLAVMSIVIFLQVVFRYIVGSSLSWSEEFGRYLLVYLSFLGASVAVKRSSHIGVEFIVKLLPCSAAKVMEWVAKALSLIFFIIMVVYGSKVVNITMMQTSPAMHIRMGYVYAAVIIGGFLMIIHLIAGSVKTNEIEGK